MSGPDDEVAEAIASDAATAAAEERAGAVARLLGGEDLVLTFYSTARPVSYRVEWVRFGTGPVLMASRQLNEETPCWQPWRLKTIRSFILENERTVLTIVQTRAERKQQLYDAGHREYFLSTIMDEHGNFRAEARETSIEGKLVASVTHEDREEARRLRDAAVAKLHAKWKTMYLEAP